jgi:hypothetical protein
MTRSYSLMADSNGDGGYRYYLFKSSPAPTRAGITSAETVEKVKKFLDGKYRDALRNVTGGTLSDGTASTRYINLQGLGHELYKEIPEEVRRGIRELTEDDYLHIFADDNFTIPWELVKNGGDFWGQLYVISNSTMEEEGKVEPKAKRTPLRKILNVIGHGIDEEAAAQARNLFADFNVEPTVFDGAAGGVPDDFWGHMSTADLVHFTAHGEVRDTGTYLRIVDSEDFMDHFTVTSLSDNLVRNDSIIFANACLSTERRAVVSKQIGFGPTLCAYGASAFIGTLDLVPARPAVLFAKNFYRHLFSGEEIGRALLLAKRERLYYEGRVSLAPLLYSLYGNPCCQVERTI